MKNLLFILCFVFYFSSAKAQNLVPNPSFEDTLGGCPQMTGALDAQCLYWKSFRASPDYFNNCSSTLGFYNPWGYQQAHTGQAYVGFETYLVTLILAREYLGVQLISPLVIGTKYYITFYISPAYKSQYANIACNKIGALVTTYPYSDLGSTTPLPNISTIRTDTIMSDTLRWYKISGSFIADSAYQYIMIGGFYDNTFVDTLQLPNQIGSYYSYDYVDDVCLSTDSLECESMTGIEEKKTVTNITIYPNPFVDYVNIDFAILTEPYDIEIENILGQQVFFKQKITNSNEHINVADFKGNILFIKIKYKNQQFIYKLIKI